MSFWSSVGGGLKKFASSDFFKTLLSIGLDYLARRESGTTAKAWQAKADVLNEAYLAKQTLNQVRAK